MKFPCTTFCSNFTADYKLYCLPLVILSGSNRLRLGVQAVQYGYISHNGFRCIVSLCEAFHSLKKEFCCCMLWISTAKGILKTNWQEEGLFIEPFCFAWKLASQSTKDVKLSEKKPEFSFQRWPRNCYSYCWFWQQLLSILDMVWNVFYFVLFIKFCVWPLYF